MDREDSAVRDDGGVRRDEHTPSMPSVGSLRGHIGPLGHWILIDADRNLLTFLLEAVIFVALVATGTAWPFEMQTLITETRAVQTLFNTLLSGIILLVSIVVSITSVVLTQEVSSLGTQEQRVEQTVRFREDLEEVTGTGVSPVNPREFVEYILRAVREEAVTLRERVRDGPSSEYRRRAVRYLDAVVEEVDETNERLDQAAERPRDVLFVGLEYDYSQQLYAARRFTEEYGDEFTAAEADGFQNLVELLQFFATGREYFKTLYIETELGTLSKMLLYTSLPAIVFTSYTLLAIDAGLFPAFSVPGIPRLLTYISFAFVVALSPFILLTAYVLRVVAVSEWSLGAGPLLVGESSLDDPYDWD